MTTVTIGSSVGFVGSKAFAYCTELADVYCYVENVPTMGQTSELLQLMLLAHQHLLALTFAVAKSLSSKLLTSP